jgi:hypothetical protein
MRIATLHVRQTKMPTAIVSRGHRSRIVRWLAPAAGRAGITRATPQPMKIEPPPSDSIQNVDSSDLATVVGGARRKDPNVSREGNLLIVKSRACLANGGRITADKRYYMCDGGKYDGHIAG